MNDIPTTQQISGPVVVGVDGTQDGARAIRFGAAEAQRRGVGIRLVHVLHETIPMTPMLPLFASETLHDIGAHILKDSADQVNELYGSDLPVEAVLEHGPRTAAILEHAEDASCIVLGPRSSNLHRIVTGSTTTAVAARAHCPVVCVPAGWQHDVERHRVVVGVDGSQVSSDVLRAAFTAAQIRRDTLTVVYAWRPSGQYDAAIGGRVLAQKWESEAAPAVAELVAGWRSEYPDVEVHYSLRYQRPAAALSDEAKDADLLVLGRRGEGAPLGLSLGSMARALVRSGVCPVEIVPVSHAGAPHHLRDAGAAAHK